MGTSKEMCKDTYIIYTKGNKMSKNEEQKKVVERVVIEASQELVLRCGKASIVLTADGKININYPD